MTSSHKCNRNVAISPVATRLSGLAIERSFTTASTTISKAWLVGMGDTGGGGYWVCDLVWSWSAPPPPPPPHRVRSPNTRRGGERDMRVSEYELAKRKTQCLMRARVTYVATPINMMELPFL